MTHDSSINTTTPDTHPNPPVKSTGVLGWLLELFSSIPLGVCLLVILFFYSSIGSAGILYYDFSAGEWVHEQLRQWRGLEMTEFEWFHWWPFKLLIVLISLNLIVATIRRIPFRPVRYGAWIIHTGLIVLGIGSVIYFSTKVEGDSPVVRRQVIIDVPGHERVSLPAIPGNRAVVGEGVGAWLFEIFSADPQWELLSGEDKGKRAYSVTVSVQTAQQEFLRQVIAGYPQYTEDLIRSDDSAQPFVRAKKQNGDALVNDELSLSLTPVSQKYVYLANNISKSWALYLRERGESEWVQRPIEGVPLYNDYIQSRDDVWQPGGDEPVEPDPLEVVVPPVEPDDPLGEMDITISSYLRYAMMESRRKAGGDQLNPAVSVRLANGQGAVNSYDMMAFDQANNTAEAGLMRFAWVDSAGKREELADFRERSLSIDVPSADVSHEVPVGETLTTNPDLDFTPIEGTEYAYRVRSVQEDLPIEGRNLSLAMVELRKGDQSWLRWAFNDPALARDLPLKNIDPHDTARPLDENIEIVYHPGRRPAPVVIVAGPQPNDLGMQVTVPGRPPQYTSIEVNEPMIVSDDIELTITRYAPNTVTETRPAIVPRAQRNSDARERFSMVKVHLGENTKQQTRQVSQKITPTAFGKSPLSTWVPFHYYAFRNVNETLRRHSFRPAVIPLPDGRRIEMIFSRQREPLLTPVLLEDFVVKSHVGGFTGQTSSIRDWQSVVRFRTDDGWSSPRVVSVNDPAEFGGYWYFQSQWDPPSGPRFQGDRPSAGLNYTVLGVGNRHGVIVQLVGTIIAVLGMIYAFYVKPIIKRRQQRAVYARVREASTDQTHHRELMATERAG